MNLRTELIRVAKENPNLRKDLLPLLTKTAGGQTTSTERGVGDRRRAGFDVALETVFLSLVPGKRNFPVNTDAVKDIQAQWVEIEGKGAVNASVQNMTHSREYFTGPQEKMGARNETIVTLDVPVEAREPLLRDIVQILKPQFAVKVLPRYRDPVSVQPNTDHGEYKSPLQRRFR